MRHRCLSILSITNTPRSINMKLTFKADPSNIARAKSLLNKSYDHLYRYFTIEQSEQMDASTISYQGDHEHFVADCFDFMELVFFKDLSNHYSLRPVFYQPDDKRFYWNENIQKYLQNRSRWSEFKVESMSYDVPARFLSQFTICNALINGIGGCPLSELKDYSTEQVNDCKEFLNRFSNISEVVFTLE